MLPMPALASSVPTSMRVALVSPSDVEIYPLTMMDRDLTSMLTGLVYESLVVLDDDRKPAQGLGLATSWEQLSDGRTWVFTIREGVYFHDGTKLTAYDVAATMDAIKAYAGDLESAPTNENGRYANVPRVIKSWRADDDHTLTVTGAYSSYGVLYAMTFPVLQAQSVGSVNPPGTGPYRLAFYMPGEEIWLVGNENWYAAAPHISEIVGVFCQTDEEALQRFESEDVDIVMTRSTTATRYRGTGSSRTNSYDYATQQLECLLINNGVRKSYMDLGDIRMRTAIAHAINKPRLTSNVYQNMVSSTDTLQSTASWLYNEDIKTYPYNTDEAVRLLEEMGWETFNDDGYRTKRSETGETIILEARMGYYDESGSSLRQQAANEIADMLRAVGIRVRMTQYTFENAAQKLTSGDFDLFLCAYNFDVVPDPSFVLLGTGRGNYSRYKPEVEGTNIMNALCQELRKASDDTSFQGIWYDIQETLAADIGFIPLYWRSGVVLTRYAYSSIRDIREYELLRSINLYQ